MRESILLQDAVRIEVGLSWDRNRGDIELGVVGDRVCPLAGKGMIRTAAIAIPELQVEAVLIRSHDAGQSELTDRVNVDISMDTNELVAVLPRQGRCPVHLNRCCTSTEVDESVCLRAQRVGVSRIAERVYVSVEDIIVRRRIDMRERAPLGLSVGVGESRCSCRDRSVGSVDRCSCGDLTSYRRIDLDVAHLFTPMGDSYDLLWEK